MPFFQGKLKMILHYVLVGTFTKDIIPGGYTPGGTVYYSGVQAKRLGVEVTIISTAESDIDLSTLEPGIKTYIQESPESTTFENVYDKAGNRIQYLTAKAKPLRIEDAPSLDPPPSILHLGPLVDEVPIDYWKAYPGAKIAVTPQGWMRQVQVQDKRVMPRYFEEAQELLPNAWAMVFSEEDVGYDESEINRLADLCSVTVCTRNLSAASLFVEGERSEVPVHPSTIVDPTGAGDVFTAAFFVWLHETNDPVKSVKMAHIAAGMSISGQGVSKVLTRAEITAIYDVYYR